jgi:alkaline phosphatase D
LPLILTLLSIYLTTFTLSFITEPATKVLAEEVDLFVRESDAPPTITLTPDSGDDEEKEEVEQDATDNSTTSKVVQIEAVDTVVIGKRHPHIARTLLSGYPSPTSKKTSLLSAGLNILLALGSLDSIYRGPKYHGGKHLSFARTGYVSHNLAKLLVREPDVSQLPISVAFRELPIGGVSLKAWKPGPNIKALSDDGDFTSVLELRKLSPLTRYEWRTTTNHSGIFTTAPAPGRKIEDTFTFLSTSCIKPNFPYNPFTHPLSIPGFQNLAKNLPALKAKFMLFLGDFIYIDVPRRLGSDIETYRREYRMVYGSPDWPAVSKELPWIHVIDDHEIANDWDKNISDPYPAAADPWQHYHAAANPPEYRAGQGYFTFVYGPASFFMLETRKYRSAEFPESPNSPNKTMLGPQQLKDLISWLRTDEGPHVRWKFVISSVPFTKNWRFGFRDTWAGYLYERSKILEAMWDVPLSMPGKGVVVLSGDRHEFAATKFPPPVDGIEQDGKVKKWPIESTVHEFSVSPLNQFYVPHRTYTQIDHEDVMIRYLPDGQSKFGAIQIKNDEIGGQSLLTYRLFVGGEEKWRYLLTSTSRENAGNLWT